MRSHLKTILLFLVVALLVAWYVRSMDARQLAEVRTRIAAADVRLILVAAGLICSTYVMRALRWRVLLGESARAGLNDLFAATTVGFASVFLVGRAGEIVRPAYLALREPRVNPATAFLTIAVERVCDMAMIAVLFALALPFVSAADAAADARLLLVRRAGMVILAGAVVGIIFLLIARRFVGRITRVLDARAASGGSAPRVASLLSNLLRRFEEALGIFGDAGSLLRAAGWSALLWGVIVLTYLLVLRAFGLNVGAAETVFVMGCSLVGSLVPAPGGAAGTYHAATAGGLALLGAPQEQALAAAFVLHLVVWSPALPFGAYYFVRGGVRLDRLREIASRQKPDAATDSAAARAAG